MPSSKKPCVLCTKTLVREAQRPEYVHYYCLDHLGKGPFCHPEVRCSCDQDLCNTAGEIHIRLVDIH